ncbi:SNF2 family helicase/ATPase, putative [Talaromyces stipitatus ATCC 10500]|uniref:SNF2 family helicase/ATPase, putative n=1 Tax=Talaromyces stipitatus (strain ATCC 10500 / CBS 375.48 / QM 6759 / NRRL 1006) TaxID=441959 RepID=B8MBS9_TALSN|nr:SNF2 family helicase/ATPase, putative [Talaromyces stipitatus ATCC 10500]EED18212.1 SNF2 family helicase/ATPase, putative [Talaromyces stipitatus ATCC 10500]
MDQDQEDPIDWSVDQVVQYLCHNNSTPWSVSKHPSPLPDRQSLETAIREHGITGEVLLDGRLENFLRNSLKLKEGPFYTVNKAIQYAQRQSRKYQAQQNQERSQFASAMFPMMVNNDRAWTHPFNPPWFFNTATASIPQLTGLNNAPKLSNNGDRLPDQQLLSSLQATQPPSSPQVAELDDVELPDVPVEASRRRSNSVLQIDTPVSLRLRPNEAAHTDERGQKRRRLDLTAIESPTPLPRERSERSTEEHPPRYWYIGPGKIDAASVFYPTPSDSNEDNWFIFSSKHSAGQRLFVKRKMHRFFRKEVIELPSQNGACRYAMLPYDEDDVNRGKPRYYTLYTSHKGRVEVNVKSTADTTEDLPFILDQASRAKEENPYDYLLKKYPPKDDSDSYPIYGESGSEGDYDSDTWREMDDEREEAALKPSKYLSSNEVDAIIDQRIAHYEGEWRTKQLPKLELGAHKIWFDAFKKKCRNLKIKIALDDIERLKLRLGKIREALHEDEWLQPSQLIAQCEVMEPTIFEIESQKRRVAILELPQCPPKPHSVPRPAAKPKGKANHPLSDEESLGFDSDSSLRNFIEDDMDVGVRSGSGSILPRTDFDSKIRDTLDVTGTHTESGTPIKTRSSPAQDLIHQEEVLHDGGIEVNPGSEAVPQPRCGFYYSSDSASESDYEPPDAVSGVGRRKTEIIDLTGSPPRSNGSSTPITRFANTRNQQNHISDDILVVIPSQKPRLSSKPRSAQRSKTSSAKPDGSRDTKRGASSQADREDPRQILERMVEKLSESDRTEMLNHFLNLSDRKINHLLKIGLRVILKEKPSIKGVSPEESHLGIRATVFYIAWVNRRIVDRAGIRIGYIQRAIDAIERSKDAPGDDLLNYLSHFRHLLKKSAADSTPSIEDSDDDGPITFLDTPRNKRRRRLKEDQAVKSGQVAARQRVENQERQRKILEERFERIGVSNSDPEHQAVSFEQPTIFLHPQIGGRVKPHQLAGIQFMWRELIQNEKRDGCLLAHTMGLGKTMQVISLLVTIAAAANSPDPAIRKQVPEFFHRSQTLVLCPPSLIDNWYEEFNMWAPRGDHKLGQIRKVAQSDPLEQRMSTIEEWDTEGGVLILSYHLFRNWVAPELKKSTNTNTEMQFPTRLKDQLLKGPRIIVADEAHQMKNKSSQLARAAAMLESRSRIALTGSPLANNLMDYYAMVNWISPKYLDELAVFRAKYLEPIEQGLFSDSTYQEQRRSLKKLQVLKQILTPKIHRADISVLEGSLPSKTEFVITVPMTEVQKRTYNHYVTSLMEGKNAIAVSSATFLTWMAVLGLCCNHPACFYDKVAKRAEEHAPKPANEEPIDPETFPAEVPLSSLGFNEAMWASQKQLLSDVPDLDDPKHSHRADIFKKIVEESVRLEEKILCFSQSIPTLDYLERLLRSSGVRFYRLDGSTAVKNRQKDVKSFNQGEISVYLISTRAGGLGLNITGANRVIIFDFSFNPTWEEQAVGRAYRLGQEKPVYVYRFLAGGTYEEVVHNKSIFKTQLAMRVVDKKNVERSATKSLGEYLFPVKDVKQEDISEYIGRDKVLDKILLNNDSASPSILNIELTETFRRENNEMLTEDEKKEMEQELELELLRMSDPAAYERKMMEAARRPEPTLVYPTTNLPTYYMSSGPPLSQPAPPAPPAYPAHAQAQVQRPIAPPHVERSFFKPPPWAGPAAPVPKSMLSSGPPPTHLPPRPDFISAPPVTRDTSESAAQAILKSFSSQSGVNNTQYNNVRPSPPSTTSSPISDQPSGLPDRVTVESLAARLGPD